MDHRCFYFHSIVESERRFSSLSTKRSFNWFLRFVPGIFILSGASYSSLFCDFWDCVLMEGPSLDSRSELLLLSSLSKYRTACWRGRLYAATYYLLAWLARRSSFCISSFSLFSSLSMSSINFSFYCFAFVALTYSSKCCFLASASLRPMNS